MHILVLEDDPAVRTMYASALEGDGHRVVVYDSFEEARKALRQAVPDALLTDVRVGAYNGLQLAFLFRSLSEQGTIVVVSGHDDPVIADEARRLPAAFFVKPVEVSTLRLQFAQ
jgi:DNA-binding NtrC family response regulator